MWIFLLYVIFCTGFLLVLVKFHDIVFIPSFSWREWDIQISTSTESTISSFWVRKLVHFIISFDLSCPSYSRTASSYQLWLRKFLTYGQCCLPPHPPLLLHSVLSCHVDCGAKWDIITSNGSAPHGYEVYIYSAPPKGQQMQQQLGSSDKTHQGAL